MQVVSRMPFYAVRVGRTPGVYATWGECQREIEKFPAPQYKKFDTEAEAESFINEGKNPPAKSAGGKIKTTKTASGRQTTPYSRPTTGEAVGGSSVPIVFTGGACVNKGRGNPRAGIGVYWGPNHPLNVSERLPGRNTNNRAEIYAAVKAAEQARKQGLSELIVKTDSHFLVNSMTKWVPSWQKKGWKTAAGNDVINKEDFEDLIEASKGLMIHWVHVKGPQGAEGNECADKLALQGAALDES